MKLLIVLCMLFGCSAGSILGYISHDFFKSRLSSKSSQSIRPASYFDGVKKPCTDRRNVHCTETVEKATDDMTFACELGNNAACRLKLLDREMEKQSKTTAL